MSRIVVMPGEIKSVISVPSNVFENIPQESAALNKEEAISFVLSSEILSDMIVSWISSIVNPISFDLSLVIILVIKTPGRDVISRLNRETQSSASSSDDLRANVSSKGICFFS